MAAQVEPGPGSGVADVRRIAVLRANALGDYICTLPALTALKAAYPDAELVLLGAPWHRRWLLGRPGPVDRVLVVPPHPGIRTAEPDERTSSMPEFLTATRAVEEFDLAIQLHGGGGNSNPIVNALGARVTAGLRAPGAEPLDRWIRYVFFQPEIHRHLEVVSLVGARPVTFTPEVAVTPGDLAEAHTVAGRPERPRVALHPGARDPRRRWPLHRFADVADALAGRGYDVVVTGTREERRLASGILATARRPVRSLAGALSLGGLAGLYAECAAVVGNDTGPLHLAAAVGTPTVGIYWVTNFVNYTAPTRGRHRPLASWTVACSVCGVDNLRSIYPARGTGAGCHHEVSFVTEVPVAEVLDAVSDLLATDEPATPETLPKVDLVH